MNEKEDEIGEYVSEGEGTTGIGEVFVWISNAFLK